MRRIDSLYHRQIWEHRIKAVAPWVIGLGFMAFAMLRPHVVGAQLITDPEGHRTLVVYSVGMDGRVRCRAEIAPIDWGDSKSR